MKMTKYLSSIILAILLPLTVFGQKDDKAKEILDKSSVTFSNAGGVYAYFTLNVHDVKAKVKESFDGTIQMKGDKFYLSTPDADSWFNGKTQWVYLKATEEVNVSEPSKEELQMISPSTLFNIYKNGFNYKYIGEKNDIKGKPVYEVELIPKKKSELQKMTIQISKKENLPVTISIFNKNEINNIIYINKYETGKSYTDSMFVFDKKKYPEAEVIDLR